MSTAISPAIVHDVLRLECRTMEDFDHKAFIARIEQRLKELSLSPRAASLQAGGSADLIRGLTRGGNRSVRGDHLVGLARVLNVSESWLVTGEERSSISTVEGVRFGGVVEAGAWRINDESNQDAGYRLVPIPFDNRYPYDSQYAFEVVGDSMTEVGIFEGMHVLAVDVFTWQRLHGEPSDGKLVVVARTRNGNPERELTVKQLKIFRDRMELRPQSLNPTWQPIVFSNPPREDEEAEAQIIAVVLSATRIY